MARNDPLGSFATGHARIDRDHVRLMDLIERAEAALRSGDPRSYRRLIGALNRRMKSHFRREARILRDIGFPDAARHCDHHEITIACAARLHARLKAGPGTLPKEEDFRELKAMVIDEIVRDDLGYKPFLAPARR